MRRLLLLFACAVLISAAQAKFGSAPVNYRSNPERTGVFDAEPIKHQPDVRWSRGFDGRPGTPLLIDNAWLIVTVQTGQQSGQIHLLHAADGQLLWTSELRGAPIGTPAYGDAQVYVGASGGGLTAYSIVDGAQVWQNTATGRVWGSALVLKDRVVASTDNGIFAIDPKTGETLWRVPLPRAAIAPAYDGESVIVASGGALVALDPDDGAERWRIERDGATWFAAAVLDGTLIGTGTEVVAYDIATREELWSARGEEPAFSAPVVLPQLVIAGNIDGHVRSYDRLTGELRWDVETPDWAVSDPVYAGGVLYFGIGNHFDETPAPRPVHALDAATGEAIWTHEANSLVTQGAAIGDRALYYADTAGQLVALRAASGE